MLKTKFRLTKCMWYQGTKYEKIAETAITEDGERHMVQTMDDGTKYFTIDNPYANSEEENTFYGRIKDAVRAVQEHYADCIKSGANTNIFNSYTYPIVLIDRKKGEEYWEKSKDGWKDAKFGYVIKAGDKNSFGGYIMLDYDGNFTFDPKYYYDTETEATEKLNTWIKGAKDFIKLYNEASDESERTKLCKNNAGRFPRFLYYLIGAMINSPEITDIKKLPNFGYEIEQYLIPS